MTNMNWFDTTLDNVCSVHRGMFSTSEGYHEYIRGIPWVHQGNIMSRSGVFSTSEGYHEYIGGCSVHRRDTMSTSGGYHDTCGGIPWVHQGMFSTSGGYHEYIGGYHEYIGRTSWVHRGMFSTSEFSIEIERILSSCPPHMYHDIPPMYWTSPDVLMISPMYSWYPSDVLNIPRCTHGIPPHSSWYPPTFIMISPDVLNIPRCSHDIPPM